MLLFQGTFDHVYPPLPPPSSKSMLTCPIVQELLKVIQKSKTMWCTSQLFLQTQFCAINCIQEMVKNDMCTLKDLQS